MDLPIFKTMKPLITFQNLTGRNSTELPIGPWNWSCESPSSWAILSEKSDYTVFFEEVLKRKQVSFQGLVDLNYRKEEFQIVPFHGSRLFEKKWEMYYQKRFNQYDSEQIPELEEFIQKEMQEGGENTQEILDNLRIQELLNRKIHQLSHGEMKRFLIAQCLFKNPKIILLDNPLEGIDPKNQIILENVFKDLLKKGISLIFFLHGEKIPDFIDNVLYLKAHSSMTFKPREWELKKPERLPFSIPRSFPNPLTTESSPSQKDFKVIEMVNFSVRYGEVEAINNLNWTVYEGERWQVSGPNGSGKSTLLNILTGDHPQAYQENFKWMGKPRGSGESIWDIKKPIGFMSPEMLVFLPHDQNVFQILASGLFDTMGLFRKLKPDQEEIVQEMAELFEIESILKRSIRSLNHQDQRIILFARTFIKNPRILILDEPFQGLSPERMIHQKEMLEKFMMNEKKTLIFTSHKPKDIPDFISHRLDLKPMAHEIQT